MAALIDAVGVATEFAGSDVAKPSGAGRKVLVVSVDFYNDAESPTVDTFGAPLLTVSDGRPFDTTLQAIFVRLTDDLAAEPATFAIAGVAADSFIAQAFSLSGCDPGAPVAEVSSVGAWAPPQQIVVPDVPVRRPGSLSILFCNAWSINTWAFLDGPTGFTAADIFTSLEFAYYYQNDVPPGSVGGAFAAVDRERFAVIQVVFQPPGSPALLIGTPSLLG